MNMQNVTQQIEANCAWMWRFWKAIHYIHILERMWKAPAKRWQWWWWWWFCLHLPAPAPLTLFLWHSTNLVMQPQLLGTCAVNEMLEIFPLKDSLFFTSVHLLVSLTLQDNLVHWTLGTWFTGGFGRAGSMIKLNDLRGLLQPKCFYDSMTFCANILLQYLTGSGPNFGKDPIEYAWVLLMLGIWLSSSLIRHVHMCFLRLMS